MFNFENPDKPERREVEDQTDLILADLFAEAMLVEEWDLDTAMSFARRAYIKGGIEAVKQFSDALNGDTKRQIQPQPTDGSEPTGTQ